MDAGHTPAPLGISGRIARAFLTSQITPLLALVGFLLGVFAIFVTPQGPPQLRQVRVGPSVRTADGQKYVEILAGLADGEQVLLNPLAK